MTDKIIAFDPQTYYHNAVIKTPSHIKSRIIRLVVDSRERNLSLFPNPNSYEINILEDVQKVISLNLLHADFPFNGYLVGSNNNILYVAYNDIVYNVPIDIGNYSETELAIELTNSINNVIGSSDFQVEYNKKKDNFKFRCKNSFGLVFRGKNVTKAYNNSIDTLYPEKSIGRLLGFGINNYRSIVLGTGDAFTNVITSEFKKNFVVEDYVVVRIDLLEINKSTSDTLNNSFAIITKNNTTYTYESNYVVKKFNPPLSKLTKLKFSFVDFYGNPIDFQNQDHRFELLLVCEF